MHQSKDIIYGPFKRKNFLSYTYFIYRFLNYLELLELDEYINYFQLLKSRTNFEEYM